MAALPEVPPTHYVYIPHGETILAPIYNRHRRRRGANVIFPARGSVGPVASEAGALLDLDRVQQPGVFDNQIDLGAVVVAPEMDAGVEPAIPAVLEVSLATQLSKTPPHMACVANVCGLSMRSKWHNRSVSRKYSLGLHEPLSQVLVKGLQETHHVAGFQYAEPTARRGLADAAVRRQRGQIEQSPGT